MTNNTTDAAKSWAYRALDESEQELETIKLASSTEAVEWVLRVASKRRLRVVLLDRHTGAAWERIGKFGPTLPV